MAYGVSHLNNYHEVTYLQLKDQIKEQKLIRGDIYKLTNYCAVYDPKPISMVPVQSPAPYMDLWFTATSRSTITSLSFSTQHPEFQFDYYPFEHHLVVDELWALCSESTDNRQQVFSLDITFPYTVPTTFINATPGITLVSFVAANLEDLKANLVQQLLITNIIDDIRVLESENYLMLTISHKNATDIINYIEVTPTQVHYPLTRYTLATGSVTLTGSELTATNFLGPPPPPLPLTAGTYNLSTPEGIGEFMRQTKLDISTYGTLWYGDCDTDVSSNRYFYIIPENNINFTAFSLATTSYTQILSDYHRGHIAYSKGQVGTFHLNGDQINIMPYNWADPTDDDIFPLPTYVFEIPLPPYYVQPVPYYIFGGTLTPTAPTIQATYTSTWILSLNELAEEIQTQLQALNLDVRVYTYTLTGGNAYLAIQCRYGHTYPIPLANLDSLYVPTPDYINPPYYVDNISAMINNPITSLLPRRAIDRSSEIVEEPSGQYLYNRYIDCDDVHIMPSARLTNVWNSKHITLDQNSRWNSIRNSQDIRIGQSSEVVHINKSRSIQLGSYNRLITLDECEKIEIGHECYIVSIGFLDAITFDIILAGRCRWIAIASNSTNTRIGTDCRKIWIGYTVATGAGGSAFNIIEASTNIYLGDGSGNNRFFNVIDAVIGYNSVNNVLDSCPQLRMHANCDNNFVKGDNHVLYDYCAKNVLKGGTGNYLGGEIHANNGSPEFNAPQYPPITVTEAPFYSIQVEATMPNYIPQSYPVPFTHPLGTCQDNIIGNSSDIRICNNALRNTIGDNNLSIIIGETSTSNYIGNGNTGIGVGQNGYIILGAGCNSNRIGNGNGTPFRIHTLSAYNRIGDININVSIGIPTADYPYDTYTPIPSPLSSINSGTGSNHNVIGDNNGGGANPGGIAIYETAQNNTVLNQCGKEGYIFIRDGSTENHVGNKVASGTIANVELGSNTEGNKIQDGCNDISIGSGSKYNYIDGNSLTVSLGTFCFDNRIGSTVSNITIGNSSNENYLDSKVSQISIGTNNTNNYLEANANNITINANSNNNRIGSECTQITLEGSYNEIQRDSSYINTTGAITTNHLARRTQGSAVQSFTIPTGFDYNNIDIPFVNGTGNVGIDFSYNVANEANWNKIQNCGIDRNSSQFELVFYIDNGTSPISGPALDMSLLLPNRAEYVVGVLILTRSTAGVTDFDTITNHPTQTTANHTRRLVIKGIGLTAATQDIRIKIDLYPTANAIYAGTLFTQTVAPPQYVSLADYNTVIVEWDASGSGAWRLIEYGNW